MVKGDFGKSRNSKKFRILLEESSFGKVGLMKNTHCHSCILKNKSV